ncbi:metallophosphoesterase [Gemmata sp.]|uniref:metallophosphoesterase n=1 Tax=Gemmata sp. TaxID=1914242 RepID=UPI003F72CFBB
MFDIIGDVHGHADELVSLLRELGYQPVRGVYAHPERKVVFLGDYIDRGPQIRQVLEVVRGMTERGAAAALMGNHEFNALCYATEHPTRAGEFLRPHTDSNEHQHGETLRQLSSAERAEYAHWFRGLHPWLERDGIRAVHACWDDESLRVFADAQNRLGRMTPDFLAAASDPTDAAFQAVEVTLKGKEAELPPGISFRDKDGHVRHSIRTRWYEPPRGQNYRDYAFQSDPVDVDEPLTEDVVAAARPYPAGSVPVFFGHYWLNKKSPKLLGPNVACLDYSVAKGGFLCAYRWDGEQRLDPAKFVVGK